MPSKDIMEVHLLTLSSEVEQEKIKLMSMNKPIENDWTTEERRVYDRYCVEFYLNVYYRNSNALVGHVVDISLGGFQLLSLKPIVIGKQFLFRMEVSLESGIKEQFEFEARSIWQNDDMSTGQFNAGFQLVDPSPETKRHFQSIISEIMSSL